MKKQSAIFNHSICYPIFQLEDPEQLASAAKMNPAFRIIRPAYKHVLADQHYIPMDKR